MQESTRILTTENRGYDMADAIEEEELGYDESFDQHDNAGCYHGHKTYDVEDAKNIENDITGTGQALENGHAADDSEFSAEIGVRFVDGRV